MIWLTLGNVKEIDRCQGKLPVALEGKIESEVLM